MMGLLSRIVLLQFLFIDLALSTYPHVNYVLNPNAKPLFALRSKFKGLTTTYKNCFGVSSDYNGGEDKPCLFPFIYRGLVYESCTTFADEYPWCATKLDKNGHLINNEWGYCTAQCPTEEPPCKTVQGGPVVGAICHFPFRYHGIEYTQCIELDSSPPMPDMVKNNSLGWCATKVDAHGDFHGYDWGVCEADCKPVPMSPDSLVYTTKSRLDIDVPSPDDLAIGTQPGTLPATRTTSLPGSTINMGATGGVSSNIPGNTSPPSNAPGATTGVITASTAQSGTMTMGTNAGTTMLGITSGSTQSNTGTTQSGLVTQASTQLGTIAIGITDGNSQTAAISLGTNSRTTQSATISQGTNTGTIALGSALPSTVTSGTNAETTLPGTIVMGTNTGTTVSGTSALGITQSAGITLGTTQSATISQGTNSGASQPGTIAIGITGGSTQSAAISLGTNTGTTQAGTIPIGITGGNTQTVAISLGTNSGTAQSSTVNQGTNSGTTQSVAPGITNGGNTQSGSSTLRTSSETAASSTIALGSNIEPTQPGTIGNSGGTTAPSVTFSTSTNLQGSTAGIGASLPVQTSSSENLSTNQGSGATTIVNTIGELTTGSNNNLGNGNEGNSSVATTSSSIESTLNNEFRTPDGPLFEVTTSTPSMLGQVSSASSATSSRPSLSPGITQPSINPGFNSSGFSGDASTTPIDLNAPVDGIVMTTQIPISNSCISANPTCKSLCSTDSQFCLTPCAPGTGAGGGIPLGSTMMGPMCRRPCNLREINTFCLDDCIEAPPQCRGPPKLHIPKRQLPSFGDPDLATYIPKVYLDPVIEIVLNAGIPIASN